MGIWKYVKPFSKKSFQIVLQLNFFFLAADFDINLLGFETNKKVESL